MPTNRTTSSSTNAARSAKDTRPDAIKLLTEDHSEVKKLFKQYNKLAEGEADASEREPLALEICDMLSVHAQIEEEIFYPACREVLGDEGDLVDEAAVEHQSAKDLIAQIRDGSADDDLYDAKVKVLGEYLDHHVKEEQDELFPKVHRKIDAKDVGEQLLMRKEELMAAAH